jgi:hypothetical protein
LDKGLAKSYYKLFSSDFLEFVKYFCRDYLTSSIPEFHKEIYGLLPSSPRIALASPRGHGKSTIASVFYPLWLALFMRRTDITIISASEGLAIEWLRKIKRELQKVRLSLKTRSGSISGLVEQVGRYVVLDLMYLSAMTWRLMNP